MEKAHSRIKWENYPSIATPLNETNLNKMDIALDEVDNRVLGLDTAKLDKAVANSMVKDISFDEATGIFTITSLDGTTKTVDTKLEKVATNFSYDYETQKLKLTLLDGTEQEIDMSTLISQYEFADTSTIGFTVGNEGKITAIVKDGSVTEDKLQPNFLADIKVEVAKGKSYSDSAYENATTSSNASKEAKQYRDEAKQYRDEVQAVVDVDIATTEKAGLVKPDGTTITVDADGTIHSLGGQGTVDYTELENKPSINGVELSGNKTLDNLGIASKTKVESLETELAKTTYKVDTVIANVKFNIEETASGEEIHLIDSAEGKAVEFALYGKATQDGEPTPENPQEIEVSGESYNLIPYPYTETTHTEDGITWTDNNGIIVANGTATDNSDLQIKARTTAKYVLKAGTYILSGCPNDGSNKTYRIGVNYTNSSGTGTSLGDDYGDGVTFTINEDTLGEGCYIGVFITIFKGATVENLTFKPMIRKASVKNDRYMPYGKGSVEVKSCGKNLLKNNATTVTNHGVTFTVNEENGSVTANGTNTHTGNIFFNIGKITLNKGETYIGNGCPTNGSISTYLIKFNELQDVGKGVTLVGDDTEILVTIRISVGVTLNNITFYPMIRLATDTDDTYEPYKETLSTIPTPNGLAGIKVSSGGNYTDQNGQQWICDEVVKYADGSGAYIQRIGVVESYSNEEITAIFMSTTGELTEGAKILYVLAEPITTPLTAEEIAEISTFYPVTNISNDFDCGMKVKYNADSKNYIDKMVAEKVASIVANMNN